ncbi:MAG: hypothetical protein KJ057_16610 [Phycisphaerae bacterium]|nr:hypothetical protein [Phycisphaerae bacterium]
MAGGGLLLTTAGALAANYTWTGHGSNDDWDTGSNWVVACCNPAYPDDSGDNATISGTHSVNLINESIGNLALSGTVIFNDADASPVQADGSAIVTDDLVPLSRGMLPGGDGMFSGATVTLTKVGGAGVVRVVAVNPNASAPYDNDWVEVPLGGNLRDDFFLSTGQYRLFDWYAEGVAPGEATLELKFENGPMPVKDRVVLTVVDVDVNWVTFSGTSCHTVKKDDGSGDFTGPHWKDADGDGDGHGHAEDRRFPVVYLRNTKPRLSASLTFVPADVFSGAVRVRSAGPQGYAQAQAEVTPSSGNLVMLEVEADKAWADTVDFFNPLRLDWRVSADGGTVWLDAGMSENQAYVTLAAPVGARLYHTLAHNSCRDAKGKSDPSQAIAAIWSDFTDRAVYRVDPTWANPEGTRLKYYGDWTTPHTTTAGLLGNADGQCTAWAQFFIDALKVQGIDQDNDYIRIESYNLPGSRGFAVKDWSLNDGPYKTPRAPEYPFLGLCMNPFITGSSYAWQCTEATDGNGITGQGQANPASLFEFHQIVFINNKYYDPSYGVEYNSILEMDDNAIASHYIADFGVVRCETDFDCDMDGDGIMESNECRISDYYSFQPNPSGNQLVEIVNDH